MPTPTQPERGERSPFVLRFGISVPGCVGIYKEPDPGAIPVNALQDGINIRIDAGEIVERGGQEKANTVAMTGCILGMIDVSGMQGFFVAYQEEQGHLFTPFGRTLDDVTPTVSTQTLTNIAAGVALPASVTPYYSMPRKLFLPFRGKLYVTAIDTATTPSSAGLFELSLSPSSTDVADQEGSLTFVQAVTGASSWVVVKEAIGEVAYIGTLTGNVYRWDGTSFTQEATAIGTNRLIMFSYAGDIYAASTNSLVKRGGSAATWNTSYAMPSGVTTFHPSAGIEYESVALIAGNDTTAKVLSFNGTTLTVSYDPGGTSSKAADLTAGGGSAFLSYMHESIQTRIEAFDGSSWSQFDYAVNEADGYPGAIKAIGNYLYWWTTGQDAESIQTSVLKSYADFDVANKLLIWQPSIIDEDTPAYEIVPV